MHFVPPVILCVFRKLKRPFFFFLLQTSLHIASYVSRIEKECESVDPSLTMARTGPLSPAEITPKVLLSDVLKAMETSFLPKVGVNDLITCGLLLVTHVDAIVTSNDGSLCIKSRLFGIEHPAHLEIVTQHQNPGVFNWQRNILMAYFTAKHHGYDEWHLNVCSPEILQLHVNFGPKSLINDKAIGEKAQSMLQAMFESAKKASDSAQKKKDMGIDEAAQTMLELAFLKPLEARPKTNHPTAASLPMPPPPPMQNRISPRNHAGSTLPVTKAVPMIIIGNKVYARGHYFRTLISSRARTLVKNATVKQTIECVNDYCDDSKNDAGTASIETQITMNSYYLWLNKMVGRLENVCTTTLTERIEEEICSQDAQEQASLRHAVASVVEDLKFIFNGGSVEEEDASVAVQEVAAAVVQEETVQEVAVQKTAAVPLFYSSPEDFEKDLEDLVNDPRLQFPPEQPDSPELPTVLQRLSAIKKAEENSEQMRKFLEQRDQKIASLKAEISAKAIPLRADLTKKIVETDAYIEKNRQLLENVKALIARGESNKRKFEQTLSEIEEMAKRQK